MKDKLPIGWAIQKIGNIAATTSGGTPNRSTKDFWGGNIPWLKSGELNDGIVTTCEEYITEAGMKFSSAKLFKKESLLLALYGATAGKLGFLDFDSTTNQAICCISPTASILDRNFLFYYLLCRRPQIVKDSFGGAQPNISQNYIRDFVIPVPPLAEQHRIVAKLDSLFERTDKAIILVEQNIANAKHLMASVLNDAFDGLDCDRVKLQDACIINPLKSEVKGIGNSEVSFLPMADLNARQIDFIPKQTKQINEVYTGYTYFKNGDVLLAKVTPCFENGKSGLATNLVNGIGFGSSEYYVLRAKQTVLPEYLYYNITSSEFLQQGAQNMSGAVGLKRVTKDFLFNYEIPVPSIEVQENVIKYFASQTTKLALLNKRLVERRMELKALKSSLLDAAFKGEL